jgi:putative acetyltransferase
VERDLEIRPSVAQDQAAIELLYPRAFPAEDLLPVVRDMLRDSASTLSLVAVVDSAVVGSVVFTKCGVEGCNVKAALLAPLAVEPGKQKQGVGSALVRAGLRRLEEEGIGRVFVLGDPGYYARFGFDPERSVETPYPLPPVWADAWQSLRLEDEPGEIVAGKLSLPGFWLDPALWSA